MTWPRMERTARWTWPLPPQMSQRSGWRALAAAGSFAGGAGDGGVHLELLVDAEDGVAEVDPDADQRVLAAADPGRRPGLAAAGAEEGLEDVLEGEALAGVAAAAEAVVGAVLVAGGVVDPALLRIREHLVGVGDGLEPVRRRPCPGFTSGCSVRASLR